MIQCANLVAHPQVFDQHFASWRRDVGTSGDADVRCPLRWRLTVYENVCAIALALDRKSGDDVFINSRIINDDIVAATLISGEPRSAWKTDRSGRPLAMCRPSESQT
jgi:hypothetical protein